MNKRIVIDTNIAFSALLNVDSRIGQILIRGGSYFEFFAPVYLKTEVIAHKEKIKELAQLSEESFIETYNMVLHNIAIIHHAIIPIEHYRKAEKLCRSIDIDDAVFVATAEFTEGNLWTGDLTLKKRAYQQGI